LPPKPPSEELRFVVRPSPEVVEVERELERLAAGDGAIVAGPWHGGIAEELLYWIPFLRWARDRFGIDPARVTAVSRGAVGLWYEGVCSTYAEEVGSGTKLSPDLARTVYERYRSGAGAIQELLDRLRFERFARPQAARSDVVAAVLPDGHDALDRLRAHGDVVTVPQTSPGAATETVAAARLFVCGPDELAFLGLFLGVPTVVLTSGSGTLSAPDLDIASRAARRVGSAFTVLDTRQLDLAALVAGARA
jgi:hypothetical protein